jgi:hypothetical protein
MANTFKNLFRGSASTTSQTLYTVPSSTTTLVNNILVANSASTDATYSLSLNGVAIATAVNVPKNDTAILDIKQVLSSTQIIAGFASASTVTFHVAGLEIT